ncbi:peptidase family M1-domain-containing protein [Lactarius indigo]|nr:peptidase family M1-domain-containing protein [Lactarius indigo]
MATSSENASDHYRLPTDVRPRHYDLTIRTDLEKEKFTGFVKIDLDIVKATKVVTFNAAAELLLGPATLVLASSGAHLAPVETKFDASTDRASLTFAEELPARAKSTWDKGIYALTQFEPTDARRALPCWDEPLLKATFSVTLVSRKGTVSLSNMPALSDAPVADVNSEALFEGVKEGSWNVTRFETTPPMSTYLLALANGEFVHLESSYKSPLSGKVRPLRIYATPDVIGQAQYALDIKEKVLPLYEQVFNIEYPLPKLDTLVANDFDAGAMENWGLITGRTTTYLVDPENADIAVKKRIAGTQSPRSRTYVMGHKIILDKIHPEWKADASFINKHLTAALRLDAKLSSHPIEVAVPDAGQIGQIFDSLSYSKAASGQALVDNGALLETREAEFVLDTSKPFKVNADTNGVYHVLYSSKRLATIASEAAKSDSIFSLSDRIGLVHDAFALGKVGYLQLSAALNLIRELRAEKEFLVWESIDANLDAIIYTWWESENVAEQLKVFRRALCSPLVEIPGPRILEERQRRRKATAYSRQSPARQLPGTQRKPSSTLVCSWSHFDSATTSTIKVLLDRFVKYIAGDTSAIPVDLLNVTFSMAVIHNGAPAYDAVLKLFESSKTPSIKVAAIRGLTSSTDAASAGAHVRHDPVERALYALREFFEANYSSINKRLETTFSMKYIVQSVYSGFGKEEDRVKAEEFFKDKDTAKYNQALAQALDGISAKAAFIERSTSDIVSWLEKWEKAQRPTL